MRIHARTLAAGLFAGAAAVCSLGLVMQPANEQANEVLRRLDRLERAILQPESELPADPEQSIEAMLRTLLARTERMDAALGGLDREALKELSQRVNTIRTELLQIEAARLVSLDTRLKDIERQFERLGPTGRLGDLVRQVETLERHVSTDIGWRLDDLDRTVSSNAAELRRLESRVRRIEAQIR